MTIRRTFAGAVAATLIILSGQAVAAEPGKANPFAAFFGEWTLKNDHFQQVWDGHTVEDLTIPKHHTQCEPVNTDMTVMCVVDAGGLKGHIFWVFDDQGGQVHHLSHFGQSRVGSGTGSLNETSDLHLKLHFTDEPDGTYRVYDYVWVSADEYHMMSRQYAADGKATGNWYGGTFVRIK